MKIVLISPYDIGRQPFALAHPAAWLRGEGFDEVHTLDLSLQKLSAPILEGAQLVAVHLGMHTATRIAMELLPRLAERAPMAHLCAYGLYAPMNEGSLRAQGVQTVLGGEYEPGLLALAQRLRDKGDDPLAAAQRAPVINLERIAYRTPDRAGLPPLKRYAHLDMPDGSQRRVGFAQATRGCKHTCRHCPVVPVYEGRFRVAPVEVVMADIRQQVAAGAEHISFGDPDFLNGPRHALRVMEAMHAEFPELSWDAVIKIEHLLKHAELLPRMRAANCVMVISAVESVDETVLTHFAKGHTAADFHRAAALMRQAGIALSPTFVPFTPWTSIEGYRRLLETLIELDLIEAVAPVQLAIRLLIPEGSWLLRLEGFEDLIDDFDPSLLGYPWQHASPEVDQLQRDVMAAVMKRTEAPRRETFAAVWALVHEALGRPAPPLPSATRGATGVPALSEPWYCCAEPTETQLAGFS